MFMLSVSRSLPFLVKCLLFLPTAREGNVFRGMCHSVDNQPHGYSVTAHPRYGAVGTHPTGMHSCGTGI